MTDTRGTFRLRDVRKKVLDEEYVSIPSVWTSNGDFGHGHYMPGEIVRYNTSNSTATVTDHSTGRYNTTSGGNPTHTYWAGGSNTYSTISKLVYSTYAYTSQIGSLPVAKDTMGVVSGETSVRYVGGGGPGGASSQMQKQTFSTDGIALEPGAPYPQNQSDHVSFNAGGANGYFWGGTNNPTNSKIAKLIFASDTFSYIPASMTLNATGPATPGYALYFFNGKLGNTTNGYTVGGSAGGHPNTSTSLKFTYSNETFHYPATCHYPRTTSTGVAFTADGDTGLHNGGGYSDTNLLTFSTESWATEPGMNNPLAAPGAFGTTQYSGFSGTSINDSMHPGTPGFTEDGPTRWVDNAEATNMNFYYGGGFSSGMPGPFFSQFFKITDSTDTHTQIGNSTVSPGYQGFAFRGNKSIGILAGGRSSPSPSGSWPDYSGTEKLTYSTETFSALPTSTDVRRRQLGAFGPESDIIIGGGGSTPSGKSNFEKMSYSATTWSTVPSAVFSAGSNPSSSGRQATHMGGNTTHGYIAGHTSVSPTHNSIVDKYTYATDSNSATPARCVQTRYGASASSDTALYVWALGSYPAYPEAMVPKLTYATDTVEQLSLALPSPSATPNHQGGSGNGHHGRVQNFGSAPISNSRSYKLDYSTDTYSNQNPSSAQRSGMTMNAVDWRGTRTIALPPDATPTASTFPSVNPALNVNAVFAAGAGPSSSTNQRSKLTFSNETMASMPAFADSQNTFGGASSTTRGYLSGSFGNTSMGDTQNKRWYNQYSNDTSGLLPSRTSQNAGGMYSMNDETKLYSGGGGWSGGQYNTAESMPFANETNTGEPGMTLTSPKKYASGIGNKTIGFVCGGNEGNSNRTTIDKVVYSTGTMSTSPSNLTLSGASPYHATMAVGNTTTGYIFQNSPTNKLVFATETVSSAPTNNTSNSWGNGTSSVTTGYVMNHPSGQYLIKYVFSTETTGTLPGMFSPNRGRGGAMSTAMFGGAYTSTPNLI